MTKPESQFFDQGKAILKRVPGMQRLKSIRDYILQIREFSILIKENRVVVFPSYSQIGNDIASTHAMVHEVMKEWIDLYGIAYLRRATATSIDFPLGAILLYAPQALLKVPSTHEEYLKGVERETRRLIRLAESQGYEFKEFAWNDHLNEIYEINTSKEIRQLQPMLGWYREPVKPHHYSDKELKYRKYYGALKDGKLYAYLHFYLCGDCAAFKYIMGHSLHLKNGIMNGLLSWTVRECIRNSQIHWLQYGTWAKGSLGDFKHRAGFQGYAFLLDLDRDTELLKHSVQKVRTIWRF